MNGWAKAWTRLFLWGLDSNKAQNGDVTTNATGIPVWQVVTSGLSEPHFTSQKVLCTMGGSSTEVKERKSSEDEDSLLAPLDDLWRSRLQNKGNINRKGAQLIPKLFLFPKASLSHCSQAWFSPRSWFRHLVIKTNYKQNKKPKAKQLFRKSLGSSSKKCWTKAQKKTSWNTVRRDLVHAFQNMTSV